MSPADILDLIVDVCVGLAICAALVATFWPDEPLDIDLEE